MCEGSFWWFAVFEMTEIYHGFLLSILYSSRCSKAKCVFGASFIFVFTLLFIIVSLSYWNPLLNCKFDKYIKNEDDCEDCSAISDCIGERLQVKPYIPKYHERGITPNFLPETNEIEVSEDLIRLEDVPSIIGGKVYKKEGTGKFCFHSMDKM